MLFMARLIYLLATTIIISCNSSTNNNQKEVSDFDTTRKTIASADSTSVSATADSIDKANANAIALDNADVNRATISLKDSILLISSSKFRDHRFFGYSKPDIHSKRMVLFSIFTNDVEGNPYHLPYGAFYNSNDMESIQVKYFNDEGAFAKFTILKNNKPQDTVYIEKKWIEFEK
jgi:hypothetical protein